MTWAIPSSGWATPSGGGSLSDANPESIGAVAAPGTALEASRSDHVHPAIFLSMWAGPGTARTVNEYTILVSDVVPHDINASGGAVELNLPTAAAWIAANPTIPFVRISAVNIANAATVDPNGAETINGAALYTFATAWDSIDLYPISGTGWAIR